MIRDNIVTFFYQGNNSSRSQAAQYAGSDGVKVIYKDKIIHSTCKNAPKILHNIHTYHEIPEVSYDWSINPIHWIMWLVFTIRNYLRAIVNGPIYHTLYNKMTVGGKIDIDYHLSEFRKLMKETNKKIVLFGCSRGAATTLVSLSKMSKEAHDKISLVIVEAPFDSLPSVLKENSNSLLAKITLWFLRNIGNYKDTQITPLQAVDNIPLNIPIAFITSKKDNIVPPQCTYRLINKLKDRGHGKLYHLELNYSSHGAMSLENKEDIDKYINFVNTLYDKYC